MSDMDPVFEALKSGVLNGLSNLWFDSAAVTEHGALEAILRLGLQLYSEWCLGLGPSWIAARFELSRASRLPSNLH